MNGVDIKTHTHSVNESMNNMDSDKEQRTRAACGCEKAVKLKLNYSAG